MKVKKPTLVLVSLIVANIIGKWSWVKDTLKSFTPAIRWIIIIFVALIISFAFIWSVFPDWIMTII